jgi:hypothetical protein
VSAPSDDGPKIKGAFIKDPRDWTRKAYGDEAYRSALSKLPENERAMVDGMVLAGSWYPIATWDRFLDAMRAEALARQGHSTFQFNMRNMREAGSSIVRGIYKFLVGLLSPTTTIEKFAVLYGRVYSEGKCDVVENVPGRAVIRYSDCSSALRSNLTHNLPTGLIFALEMNGTPNANVVISRDDVVGGKLVFEVTATYEKK